MRIRGIGRLKRWPRRATAFLRSQVVILMYHRILDADSDPWGLCVRPVNFEKHVEHVSSNYQVIGMRALAAALTSGRLPKRAVVLTFDDGYVDNLWYARPLLERFQAPATVYVAAGYLDQDREFWWDELEAMIVGSTHLPPNLQVTVQGVEHVWQSDQMGRFPGDGAGSKARVFGQAGGKDSPRLRLYRDIHAFLRPLGHEEREAILRDLRAQIGCNGSPRPGYRPLKSEEVCQLAESGLIEIGAHTMTHPVLSAQTPEIQRWELAESKRRLEALLGQKVINFSFPFGGLSDVGETARQLAARIGFATACTTTRGKVCGQDDRYALPRIAVGDWDGPEFATRLKTVFSE